MQNSKEIERAELHKTIRRFAAEKLAQLYEVIISDLGAKAV